ncbi:MAG: hypothetical protein BWX77_00084 [Bacteroidetes bacterium ADurb.Bin090]|nr:MAG: hypothetical protein BWX77_00084 [Bacteroidetes bacterium ADurb.Bin090]
MSEAPDKAGYILELLQVGAVVNSVDKGFFAFFTYEFGHRFVGQKHKFLDQVVGFGGGLEMNFQGLPFFVHFEADF